MEELLDCRGLKCPMPIVRASQAIKAMGSGGRLRVISSDPAFRADIQAWTKQLGHKLVEFKDGPVQEAVTEKS